MVLFILTRVSCKSHHQSVPMSQLSPIHSKHILRTQVRPAGRLGVSHKLQAPCPDATVRPPGSRHENCSNHVTYPPRRNGDPGREAEDRCSTEGTRDRVICNSRVQSFLIQKLQRLIRTYILFHSKLREKLGSWEPSVQTDSSSYWLRELGKIAGSLETFQ